MKKIVLFFTLLIISISQTYSYQVGEYFSSDGNYKVVINSFDGNIANWSSFRKNPTTGNFVKLDIIGASDDNNHYGNVLFLENDGSDYLGYGLQEISGTYLNFFGGNSATRGSPTDEILYSGIHGSLGQRYFVIDSNSFHNYLHGQYRSSLVNFSNIETISSSSSDYSIIINNEIVYSTFTSQNLTCETEFINYSFPQYYSFPSNGDINDNQDPYTIIDNNNYFTLSNYNSFTGSLDNAINSSGSLVISSTLNPFSRSLITVRAHLETGMSTFRLEGSGNFSTFSTGEPFIAQEYFTVSNCSDFFLQNPELKAQNLPEKTHFEFGKNYELDSSFSDLCFGFDVDYLSDLTLDEIKVGDLSGVQFVETLICSDDDTGEILIGFDEDNLETYTGSIDDIGDNSFSVIEELDDLDNTSIIGETFSFSSVSTATASGYTSELESTFGINQYLQFIDFSLPSIPNLTLDVPIIELDNDFKVELNFYPATLVAVTDRVGSSSSINKDIKSKYFLSFLFVFLYISFRFSILLGLFYIFKKFYKFLDFISVSLFGHGIKHNSSGNIFSLAFYIFFLVFVFGVFAVLFSYILQFDTIILSIISYGNVFVTWLVVSFGDYEFFSTIINFFFASIILGILFFIMQQLIGKFGKLN